VNVEKHLHYSCCGSCRYSVASLFGLWANRTLFSANNNAIPQPTNTPTPTSQPTNSPAPETPIPSVTPQPSKPTQTPSQTTNPTTQPTVAPTSQPTPTQTAVPTPTPTATPTTTSVPTATPTPTPSPTPAANVAISYSLTTSTYYTWTGVSGTQYKEYADTGNTFVQITLTAKNNGYESFNTNPNYFYLITDNLKYTYDSGTYSVDTPTKWSTVDILNSGTFTGTILFEVPNKQPPSLLAMTGS